MSADSLSTTSRGFYERSKGKVTLSLVLGAASMMLLGFCANAGGQAASNAAIRNHLINLSNDNTTTAVAVSQDTLDAYKALIAGYGFGAFVYILGFILLAASAIYTSPLICGTSDETKIIKSPQEINGGGGVGYAPEPYNRAAPTGGV